MNLLSTFVIGPASLPGRNQGEQGLPKVGSKDTVREKHQVVWEWVKGHAGHPENELADELARSGMDPFKAK